MKNPHIILNVLLLFNLMIFSLSELCSDNQINIAALKKCISIDDFLQKETLQLQTINLLYLSSNEKIIEKNGYKLEIFKLNDTKLQSHNKRKSKLYIPNSCLEKMESHEKIKLDRSKGIVVLVSDSNKLNKNNISNNYFIIRHNSENSEIKYINSKNFDFSFCSKDPILFEDEIKIDNLRYNYTDNKTLDINTLLYGRKYGIDLFDIYNDFFNDICFKFKSEKGSDVTLESRVEDYYQNITFCDEKESSHYLGYNYSENKRTISYRCAYGFYKNENEKSSYIDIVDSEIKEYVSVSNVKVITCYKQFLNLKDIIKNYGGGICIIVLIIQIICFLLFCFLGIKYIRRQLEDLFYLGSEIIKRKSLMKETNLNIEKENDTNTNLNSSNQEKLPKLNNEVKNEANPPKKEINTENTDDKIKVENKIEGRNKNNEQKVVIDDKDLKNKYFGSNLTSSTIRKERPKKSEYDKETNADIKSVKSEASQLYEYENEELNELPYDKAIKNDKRSFCGYYCNILLISHIILNVFFRRKDYNLFVVKLGLLFMTFPINLTFNIFFFTNEKIKLTYVKSIDEISAFWSNIANTIYSSILSSFFLILLKYISLTHNSIRSLRKIKDVNLAKQKSVCLLRWIKVRIFLYYILSFIILIIFGFYILCFCAVFENTQIVLVKSTFTSWLFSLIIPFIICFITSLFRSWAFCCKCKCFYVMKQLFQWL